MSQTNARTRRVGIGSRLLGLTLAGAMAALPAAAASGVRGDGDAERSTVAPVRISLSRSPIERLTVEAEDGVRTEFLLRKPKGRGPFPTVVLLHGGIGRFGAKRLRSYLLEGATYTRLLERGYVVVAGDYRDYGDRLQSPGPILDALAVVERVRELPYVAAEQLALFGGSGGGSIALEVAAETPVAAVVVGEPATIIFAGLLDDYYSPARREVLRRPLDFYTPERRAATRAKLARIEAPILLLSGEVHQLRFANRQILIPELEALGKRLTVRRYPENPHGFYWGNSTDLETLERVVEDVDVFLRTAFGTRGVGAPERRDQIEGGVR